MISTPRPIRRRRPIGPRPTGAAIRRCRRASSRWPILSPPPSPSPAGSTRSASSPAAKALPCALMLKPGQRLVSKEGDLWRWDGFVQAAEAPTPAARRLAEKNRLGDLIVEAEAARDGRRRPRKPRRRRRRTTRPPAPAPRARRDATTRTRCARSKQRARSIARPNAPRPPPPRAFRRSTKPCSA